MFHLSFNKRRLFSIGDFHVKNSFRSIAVDTTLDSGILKEIYQLLTIYLYRNYIKAIKLCYIGSTSG